jgi:2-polyprenyl-3-methyl-5-hydroxy-6-metoxy-1,4-benzoquinol methylase
MELENVSNCLSCDSSNSELIETTSTMMGGDKKEWNFRKCSDCKLVYLSSRVPLDQLDAYYTASYLPYRGAQAWGKYAKLVEGDQKNIDKKRLKLVQQFIHREMNSILDIGCGKPSFLKLFQDETGFKAMGLDFSDKGWRTDHNLYDKLDLHIGSIADLPNETKADLITMWHYLEHDYYPKNTLRSLSNSQKKDARLIIEVPNHDSYTRKRYGRNWSGYHAPRHTVLYTPDTLKSMLESNGWEVQKILTYGTLDPYTLDWMSRMEIKNIDWTKSMEPYFTGYVLGKIFRPRYYLSKFMNQGFMTAIARNRG